MQTAEVPKEVRKRIEKVINHVLRDLQGDLSLETLAGIANYSPYHFQKLFKQVTGESPKQYVLRMRLESAAHFLVIQPVKPVQAIAIDCGFSSPAVFARAFKNHFEINAEEFRVQHIQRRVTIKKRPVHLKKMLEATQKEKEGIPGKEQEITITTMPVQYGIFLNTGFDSVEGVEKVLKEIVVQASAHDLFLPGTKVMGIIYPHHNIYRAFIPVDPRIKVPASFNRTEIRAGKFAVFKVKGSLATIFDKLHWFYKTWLPENGYKIADICGFEVFAENPAGKAYNNTEREVFVPIEPV